LTRDLFDAGSDASTATEHLCLMSSSPLRCVQSRLTSERLTAMFLGERVDEGAHRFIYLTHRQDRY
jgi:hypothetical protein